MAQKQSSKSSSPSDSIMMRPHNQIRIIPTKTEKSYIVRNNFNTTEKPVGKRSETGEENILVSDKPQRAAPLAKLNSFNSQEESEDDHKSEKDPFKSQCIATEEPEIVNEKGSPLLDNERPQKQDVIVKGPRELSCIYEDKPAPRWPLQMNLISPAPMLSKEGKDVDFEENFSSKKVLKEHPDFSLAISEPVYEADYSNPDVIKLNLYYRVYIH